MRERAEFKSKQYDLTRGRVPIFLRAAAVKDDGLRSDIRSLFEKGVTEMTVTRRRKIPQKVRNFLHESADASSLISKSLQPAAQKEDERVAQLRKLVDTGITITTPSPSKEQQIILSKINTEIRPAKERYALRRFAYDRPAKELKMLSYIGIGSVVAAGVATGLEIAGIKGWGLLAAQSADDVGNAAITVMTEKHEKKSGLQTLWQVTKDNWPVGPVLAVAAMADNTIIPPLLESPHLGVKEVGGLLFNLAAVGGSLCVNVLQTRRRRRKLKIQPEGKITTKQHPFNTALWVGIGLSAVASEVAAAKGMLLNHFYSGTLQTVIGQLETITAFAGLYSANAISTIKEHVSDWLSVKKAKKSVDIFPNKK